MYNKNIAVNKIYMEKKKISAQELENNTKLLASPAASHSLISVCRCLPVERDS